MVSLLEVVKLHIFLFILISKNIFTNLFSRAWLTLGLRFVLPGRGFSAKLRPLLPTRMCLFWNYDFCGSYVTRARLIKPLWWQYRDLLRKHGPTRALIAWKWFLTVIDWLFHHSGANHVRFCQKCPDSYSDCGRPETKVDRKQSLARINRENIKIVSKR